MKALQFIYQDTQIHFLLNPLDNNVMVNATEMAKIFGKETRVFLKTDHAKAFIKVCERALNGAHSDTKIIDERAPNGARSNNKIIDNRGHVGIYFNKRLALKFAAWLSPEFEYWVYSTIDEIVFGHYKKHWEAHAIQEEAKVEMEHLKSQMLTSPSIEINQAYFKALERLKSAKNQKSKAIRNQLKMMF